MKKLLVLALAALIGVSAAYGTGTSENGKAASGTKYPAKKLIFVVSFKAGGPMDGNSRFLAPYLEKHLGIPVEVRNVAGGNGWIGWKQVADSSDGSMITYGNWPKMDLNFIDPANTVGLNIDSFSYLAMFTSDPNVLMVNPDEKRFSDGKSFLEYAKTHKTTVGTAGAKGDDAVAIALMMKAYPGLKIQRVNFPNSAEGQAALLGHHMDALVGNVSEVVRLKNEVKPLFVFAKERNKYLPNLPCTYEIGVKAAAASSRGVLTGKNVPQKDKDMLIAALKAAMEDPELLKKAPQIGIDVVPMYGQNLYNYVKENQEQLKGIFNMLDK
jgi:tripartite-type tricarboxylate transporter receptor subunit TctC